MEDEEINAMAKELLAAWNALEMSYRIARREGGDGSTQAFSLGPKRQADLADEFLQPTEEARAPNAVSWHLESVAPPPLGTASTIVTPIGTPGGARENGYARDRSGPRRSAPAPPQPSAPKQPAVSIEDIIKRANEAEAEKQRQAEQAAAAARAAAAEAEEKANKKREAFLSGSAKKRSGRPHSSSSDKKRRTDERSSSRSGFIEDAERRLKKLVGEVVVRCMSKHKDELDRDAFKKHAKDLTTIICEKEKKNPKVWPPARDSKYLPEGFSREKRDKIASFAKDYVTKLVAHRRAKHGHVNGKHANGVASASETPASGTSVTSGTPHEPVRGDGSHDDVDDVLASDDDDDGGDDASSRHSPRENDQSETSVSPATSGAPQTSALKSAMAPSLSPESGRERRAVAFADSS